MKRIYAVLLATLIIKSVYVYGQVDASMEYESTISAEDAYDKLSVLASDAMEGRETGERGQKMAAAFIQFYFEKIGLTGPVKDSENPYFQNLPLIKGTPGETWLMIGNKKLSNFDDILYFGKSDLDYQSKEVVLAGNGSEADFAAVDVKGKVALIHLSENNRGVSNRAYENGAEFVLIVPTETEDDFMGYIKQRFGYATRAGLLWDIPERRSKGYLYVSPESAAEILGTTDEKIKKALANEDKSLLKKIPSGKLTFHSEITKQKVSPENVLGYLEGSDKKDELVIITAHYDHIGRRGDDINNGADDDGSGTTALIEIAEAFAEAKKNGNGPRRSMLFMAVTGEEKGLLGSQWYTSNPVFPLDKTVVDLNIDMVGRVDPKHKENPDYVYLVGSDRLSSELHEISEKVNSTYTQMSLDYTYNDEDHPERIYYRSDHWNFAKNNIPIIFYFNGTHEDYHQPTDTVDKINFEMLVKRTRLVYHTAWVLANREDRIVVDKLQDANLDNK